MELKEFIELLEHHEECKRIQKEKLKILCDEYAVALKEINPKLKAIEQAIEELREIANAADEDMSWDLVSQFGDDLRRRACEIWEGADGDEETKSFGLRLTSYQEWVDWHSSAC